MKLSFIHAAPLYQIELIIPLIDGDLQNERVPIILKILT